MIIILNIFRNRKNKLSRLLTILTTQYDAPAYHNQKKTTVELHRTAKLVVIQHELVQITFSTLHLVI